MLKVFENVLQSGNVQGEILSPPVQHFNQTLLNYTQKYSADGKSSSLQYQHHLPSSINIATKKMKIVQLLDQLQ